MASSFSGLVRRVSSKMSVSKVPGWWQNKSFKNTDSKDQGNLSINILVTDSESVG
jgi:hypothetical protein